MIYRVVCYNCGKQRFLLFQPDNKNQLCNECKEAIKYKII